MQTDASLTYFNDRGGGGSLSDFLGLKLLTKVIFLGL